MIVFFFMRGSLRVRDGGRAGGRKGSDGTSPAVRLQRSGGLRAPRPVALCCDSFPQGALMAITLDQVGKAVLDTQYAVRGPIVTRAQELERAGREIIYCNIGNPQSLEQKPVTWFRQVLALCEWPQLMDLAPDAFPSDVVATARNVLAGTVHGVGAYSESKGVRFIREAVASFIRERDGIASDPEAIFLTDGASKGVQSVLRILIAGPQDGIMIPIPQYPLYSATITLYEGKQVPYYLDEAHDWRLDRTMLEESS